MKQHQIFICLSLLLTQLGAFSNSAKAQGLTQTVRGTVTDAVTKQPLPGATIQLINDLNSYGQLANQDGSYSIENVKIGRYNVKCNYAGYEPFELYQIEVTATKELVLRFEMIEDLTSLEAAVINMRRDKSKTINSDIQVSGRTFSIEESQRYAGSRGDVARMAQNFAGVQGADDSRNDIIVRGNSPMGVLYRIEGIDIPNPNHYSSAGTTGGPVSMLNNNILQNSDFISGAFPAEYGNANAAVFDLGVRRGNDEKFEFLGQVGFAGFEGMVEGPIKNLKGASFLVNYRYSALGFLSDIGINFGTGTAVPKYEDLSFKLYFPDKLGHTSIFGLGGKSNIKLFQSTETEANLFRTGQEDLTYSTQTGVIGLTRYFQIGNNSNLKFILATDAASTKTNLDTFSINNGEIIGYSGRYRDQSEQGKHSFNVSFTHKFNARLSFSAGSRFYRYFFNLQDSFYNQRYGFWVNPTQFNGNTSLSQTYANVNYRINSKLRFNIGINQAIFLLNDAKSTEPRFGLSYQPTKKYKLSIGAGLHSQLVPFRVYFEESTDSLGNKSKINQEVGLMRSAHFVVGNDFRLTKNVRLKVEGYYQHLYDIPVDAGDWTDYSMLNQGTDFGIQFTDSLVNKGTGRNYGVEFTLERFLTKGLYFLNTVSIYRSLYTDRDGNEYSTAFDGRYAANLLVGKEFYFAEKDTKKGYKKPSMTVDIKTMINGGKRYTPIDVNESRAQNETVFTNNIYGKKYNDYMRLDLRIAFKVQSKKITQEWGIDIQNTTNRKNVFTQNYDASTGKIRITYQTGLLPIGIYRATF